MTNPVDPSAINPLYSGTDLGDDLTLTHTNLFGTGVDPTQPGVNPVQSQAIVDGIHQLVNGGDATGLDASTVPTNLSQFPQEYVVATPPRYTSVLEDAAGTWTPTTTATATGLTGTHVFGATADHLIVRVAFDLSATPTSMTAMCGSAPMTRLNTPTGAIGIVAFGLAVDQSGGLLGSQTITVALGGTPTVHFLSAQSTSFIGVASVGGVGYSNAQVGPNPSVTLVSSALKCIAQSFFNRMSGASAAMSAYSKTQTANTGNVVNGSINYAHLSGYAAGAPSVTFSAASTGVSTWYSLAVVLIPSPSAEVGSFFKQVRQQTGTFSVLSGENLFTNGFFETNRVCTSDIISAPTSANQITVSYEGAYLVKIRIALNGTATNYYACPILYQNGSVVEYGGPPIFVSNNSNNYAIEATFIVYCAANDTLQPGMWCSTAVTNLVTGEATGLHTLWSCALMNRSYM